MTTTARRIVFLGTHGQYNIGDELLLESFLAQLGTEHHYVVNSYDPEFTRAQLSGRYTVDVIDTSKDRPRLLRELLRCDLVCFGGGSIIKELYASTGRNRYSTLLMILAIVTFTNLIARKPIAMLNIGVGPLRSPGGLRLARWILSQVDELTVRDEKSRATAGSVGVSATRATDAVFSASAEWLLGRERRAGSPASTASGDSASESSSAASVVEHASSASEAPSVSEAPSATRVPLRVALNLNFDIENPENWETFLERLALALEQVHAEHPIELHGLAMQVGFKENDDAEILDAFAARLASVPFHPHSLRDHKDVARLIEESDLVISERFHSIVIASILGVPSMALAYDVKVTALADMIGLAEWTVDINQPFDARVVAGQVLDLIARRETVAVEVRERSADLARDARQNFDAIRQWIAGLPVRNRRA